MKHALNYLAAAAALLLFGQPHAWAWGCKGHQTVAFVALAHLDPAVAAQVDRILSASPIPDSQRRGCAVAGLPPIVNVSTWADDSHEPGTSPDHYVDIPLGAVRAGFDLPKLCAGNCVTWAIAHYTAQLKSSTDPEERAKALRYVVHFVGDIHQPLHGEDNADRGGNCVPARLLGATNTGNLHSVWDSGIIGAFSPGNDANAFAHDLAASQAGVKAGSANPEDWAWESHDLALSRVYAPLPIKITVVDQPPVKSCAERAPALAVEDIDQAYVDQARPVIEAQIEKAGLRLAALLNQTLSQ